MRWTVLAALWVAVVPWSRRLQDPTLQDPCVRMSFLATLLCPELVDGDVRGACAACGPLVSRLLTVCGDAAPFPGTLCSGDCRSAEAADVAPTCGACGDCLAHGECATCPPACLGFLHCLDPTTGALDPADAFPRRTLADCEDTRRVHAAHGCCAGDGAFGNALYVRVE